jgi:hypothetical protein
MDASLRAVRPKPIQKDSLPMAWLLGKAQARPDDGMRLDPNEMVAGVPLIKVRHLMRQMCVSLPRDLIAVSRQSVAECTGADIADALVEAGYLAIRDKAHSKRGEYTVTELGITLSCGSFIKRISRAKAKTIVERMLKRAEAINADSDLIYWIAELRAFGSFITDAPDLGDIDIAVSLMFKKENGSLVEANKARAKRSGRTSMSILEECSFGYHEIYRLLKARSPYISLQSLDDVKRLGCNTELLYSR